jgi:regulator of ribosome biosynthesis
MEKNERQRKQNDSSAQTQSKGSEQGVRKKEIERTLATTRVSTASMGRFDRKLEGEKKLRGVKRKVGLLAADVCIIKLSPCISV